MGKLRKTLEIQCKCHVKLEMWHLGWPAQTAKALLGRLFSLSSGCRKKVGMSWGEITCGRPEKPDQGDPADIHSCKFLVGNSTGQIVCRGRCSCEHPPKQIWAWHPQKCIWTIFSHFSFPCMEKWLTIIHMHFRGHQAQICIDRCSYILNHVRFMENHQPIVACC